MNYPLCNYSFFWVISNNPQLLSSRFSLSGKKPLQVTWFLSLVLEHACVFFLFFPTINEMPSFLQVTWFLSLILERAYVFFIFLPTINEMPSFSGVRVINWTCMEQISYCLCILYLLQWCFILFCCVFIMRMLLASVYIINTHPKPDRLGNLFTVNNMVLFIFV